MVADGVFVIGACCVVNLGVMKAPLAALKFKMQNSKFKVEEVIQYPLIYTRSKYISILSSHFEFLIFNFEFERSERGVS
ncbi:hypothetical protein NIES4071_108880 (plasmid) [Calothrix sp. NIES-4071]|nr:hypothetical protein NIES4071_108880 [Calothrix sp. NIES-4071]BAZ65159.1 hypothetical protein NIES4105_108920 [Calothrix sp. NIES-4105]